MDYAPDIQNAFRAEIAQVKGAYLTTKKLGEAIMQGIQSYSQEDPFRPLHEVQIRRLPYRAVSAGSSYADYAMPKSMLV